jgi:aspartyl-tRNA(Asn)/glutamyl-tRNA(Gln) amidotransferase subunit C
MSDKSKTLTKEDLAHVANLVKIYIPAEELEGYREQLSDVLSHLEVFQELDTTNIPITSQVTGLVNVLRADEITPSLTGTAALQNTKHQNSGYFVVKKVLKK